MPILTLPCPGPARGTIQHHRGRDGRVSLEYGLGTRREAAGSLEPVPGRQNIERGRVLLSTLTLLDKSQIQNKFMKNFKTTTAKH